MSKHTPGPWVVLYSRNGYPYQIHAPNGDDTKPGAVGSSVTRWASISLPSSNEGRANARLIAAAPRLLEALRVIEECAVVVNSNQWPRWQRLDEAITAARAAIAEATGE